MFTARLIRVIVRRRRIARRSRVVDTRYEKKLLLAEVKRSFFLALGESRADMTHTFVEFLEAF